MRRILTLSTIAIVLGLAGPAAAQSELLQWSGDAAQWSGSIAQGQTLRVQGVSGSIRATNSEDDWIHLEAHRAGRADTPVEVVQDRRGVTICAGECGGANRGRDRRDRYDNYDDLRVDFVVRVPAGIRFVGGSVSGDVEVEGVRSEMQLSTVSGDVMLQMTGYATHANTVSGNVIVDMPSGANAEISFNTVSGRVSSDFPVTLQGRDSDRRARGSFRASIGNGGPDLSINTVSGDVRLKR